MFPPETTQTTLPRPRCRLTPRRATPRPRPPRRRERARRAGGRRRRPLRGRRRARRPRAPRQLEHLGKPAGEPMPSTKLGSQRPHRLAGGERRGERGCCCDFSREDLALGRQRANRGGDAAAQPAAAERHETDRRRAGPRGSRARSFRCPQSPPGRERVNEAALDARRNPASGRPPTTRRTAPRRSPTPGA